MNRRRFLSASAATALLHGLLGGVVAPARAEGNPGGPFSRDALLADVRRIAAAPFKERRFDLPQAFRQLGFDAYRAIRYRPERLIWRDENRGFQVEPQHTGFIYQQPVGLFLVEDGQWRPFRYARDMFDYPAAGPQPAEGENLGFTGFRVRRPINAPDVYDEFAVFQGATYFSAVAKDMLYGLTARGLAIATGDPKGEEFPAFTQFWIERPEPGATALVVHAVLDSPSVAGLYRFTLRPGPITSIDVEATLVPRVDLAHVGLGPLGSMFLFDATNRTRLDDYRPAVHDSNGLAMWSGAGEWIWRPLANPRTLQISGFIDKNPRGFGLVQRRRAFTDFEDVENRYELRPSSWVEPVGDWGEGVVELIEIPSDQEIHDNIVVYWRPKAPIPAGQEFTAAYRLHFTDEIPEHPQYAKVQETRAGPGPGETIRRYVVDFDGGNLPAGADVKIDAYASAGRVVSAVGSRVPGTQAYRVKLDLDTRDIQLAELRVLLTLGGQPASETWLYRWTP